MHDLSEATPAVWFFYIVISGLIGIILWFIVRDRNDIATSLRELTKEFSGFRKELASTYATKHDLGKVSDKIDRHIDHGIIRREQELIAKEDAEA
jgi:hypothetical protein